MAETTQQSDSDRKAQECAQRWIAEIIAAEKSQRRWLERAKKINLRYRDESVTSDSEGAIRRKRRFALLWSNIETLKPAVYARPPVAIVSRRFDDADPVARSASEVLERALNVSIELLDYDEVLKQARSDYLLIARGQQWVRYVPTHGPAVTPQIPLQVVGMGDDGYDAGTEKYKDDEGNLYESEAVQFTDDKPYANGEPYRPVVYEEAVNDYVNWEDFGHGIARTWSEVGFVYRRVYLDRKQLVERFGKIGQIVPLDWGPVQQGRNDVESHLRNKAAIYEIWDKATRCVYWISKSFNSRPLDERTDPLKLPDFFPCPKPLLGTMANDSCIPVPDYVFYQDQAEEIDKLTARIGELQDALKVRGFYAAVEKTNLNTLFNSKNNTLIPVPEWRGVRDRGGAKGMVEYWPIDMVVAALKSIVEQRQLLLNDVYEITGISDVLRGMNDPASTATAERMKGVWGTLRVRDKQKEIVRFAKDGLNLKAGVICGQFSQETLAKMTNVKLPTQAEKHALEQQLAMQAQQAAMQAQAAPAPMGAPGQPMVGHNGGPPMPQPTEEQQAILASPTWEEVMALLRDDATRQFRIDVETDSTIEPDESEQKAAAIDLTTAIGQFIMQWGPQVQAQPALAPLAAEVLKFAIRRFRAGRELEAVIEQTMQKLQAMPPAQGEQPEAPDKTPVEVQVLKNQGEQMKQAAEDQREQQRTHLKLVEMEQDGQIEAARLQLQQGDLAIKAAVANRDPEPQSVA